MPHWYMAVGDAQAAVAIMARRAADLVRSVPDASAPALGMWDAGELAAHIDALTNQPITDRNVVILLVSQVNNFVPEDFLDCGMCAIEIQLWSIGTANVFLSGKMS